MPPALVEHAERVGLAARAVERKHQLAAEPFPKRVCAQERLRLGDDLPVMLERQLGVEQLLDRGEAQLLQPAGVVLRERLELRVGERASAPQLQRLPERARPLGRPGCACIARQPFEPTEVEAFGVDGQHVARRSPEQHIRSDRLAELMHRVLERRRRGLRRMLAPDLGDETLRGDRLVRPQQQQRQD